MEDSDFLTEGGEFFYEYIFGWCDRLEVLPTYEIVQEYLRLL